MKKQLGFEAQLHSVPVRNEKLKVRPAEDDPDVLIVEVELVYRGLLAFLRPLVDARRRKCYELAGLSRELFESLDGDRTVEDLVDTLRTQDLLTFLEARGLVMHYLKDLMQRGLVVLVTDGAPSGDDG